MEETRWKEKIKPLDEIDVKRAEFALRKALIRIDAAEHK